MAVSFGTLSGQTAIEELESGLANATGAERVRILNELARETKSNAPERSIEYAREALDLADRISDLPGKARALNNIGIGHYFLADYAVAFRYQNESLAVAEESGDDARIADALNNLGIIHYVWGEYDRTLDYYSRTLMIRRRLGDKKGLASALNNHGTVYYVTERYEESLEYFSESLRLYDELGEEQLAASTRNNIGLLYFKLGRFDDALEQLQAAYDIEERIGDKAGLALSLNNMGMVYDSLDRTQESLDFYRRSLAVREELSDRQGAAICRSNIGLLLAQLGDYETSLEYLNDALLVAQELNVKEIERDFHRALSDTYELMGDTERALASHKLYKELNDSLFDQQTAQRLAELTARSEVEKKDREIELLRKSRAMQRIVRNVVLAGSVLLLVLILLLYNRYRLRVRANREMQRAHAAEKLAREEREKAAHAELAHASRVTTMGELATAIAHELNQPLTAISANAQAARRFMESDQENRGHIDDSLADIVKGAGRARDLIRKLRDLVRRGEITRERLDVNDVVRDIERFARADAKQFGVTLEVRLASGLPRVSGDRIQLQQVLLNLVHNGAEAMKGSSDHGSIVIETLAQGEDAIRVAVKDSGHGLDEDAISRMFEPFYSTKADGLGMGLAICSTIIEAHGGKLWAVRNPDRGVTVQFELPAPSDPGTRD